MALWPPTLADASSVCPTENSPPVLSHTLKAQEHKNAMSQRSCRVKIFVRPASCLYCRTKQVLRMSRLSCRRRALTAQRDMGQKDVIEVLTVSSSVVRARSPFFFRSGHCQLAQFTSR